MIDWFTVIVPGVDYSTVPFGHVLSINADGEVEWQTDKWLQSRGSYDASMAVKPMSDGLCVSGCPAKFLQGHNIFGSDDLQSLVSAVVVKVFDCLNIPYPLQWYPPEWKLTRVDINQSFRLASRQDVLAWIQAAETHGNLEHRGRGLLLGTTVVWGKGSRHWSIKAYSKGAELQARGHSLHPQLPLLDQLTSFADPLLRVELQLRGRRLRDLELGFVGAWTASTANRIFGSHLAKLSLSGEYSIGASQVNHLSPALRMTYLTWQSGQDVRHILSRPTFYRHRRALLEHGIDIAAAAPTAASNVVPLLRVLEAAPVSVPDWAHGTELLFGS